MKFVNYPGEDIYDYERLRCCKNCHHDFSGRYCNRCGERVIDPEDRSVLTLLKKTFRTIPLFDNKLMRTIRLMAFKTGFVSSNYIQGRRIPFVDPLAVFLLINLLFFLFPTFQNFNSPLRTQMHFLSHSTIASEMVEERIMEEKTTLTDFTVRYDQHALNVAKVMLFSFVLILTVPFRIVNYSSGYYFRDHLFASLEFCSVSILVNYLLIPWCWIFVNSVLKTGNQETEMFENIYLAFFMGMVSLGLFYLLERRVYSLGKKHAWFNSLLLISCFFVSLHVYYAVVFFVSMWTL
jgi:hypothetical protein